MSLELNAAVGAGHTLARLSRHLERALATVDLTVPQFRLLTQLSGASPLASWLADNLAVTRPSITAIIDGAVARGLVDRQPDPDDRRKVRHALTKDGIEALAQAERAVAERLQSVLESASREDVEVIEAGMDAWRRILDAHLEAHRKQKEAAGASGH